MQDKQDEMSKVVAEAIETAKFNMQNGMIRADDKGKLEHMSQELEEKINSLGTAKATINMYLLHGGRTNGHIYS